MRLFGICLLLLFPLLIFSQERKSIKGKVHLLDEYQESVSGIYVKNLTTNHTTITDITGNFIISAQKNDVILFQAYNIQKRTVSVTSTMEQRKQMFIQLDLREKQLDDIYITPFKTYGSIELDVKRIPMMNKTNELLTRLGNLSPDRKLDGSTDVDSEAAKQAVMKIEIDDILDLISGDNKRKERLAAYENQIKNIKNIRDYFGDEYFIGIGLEKTEIDEFILYTYLNHEVKFFYEYNNYFQILNVFDKTILAYKALKKQPLFKPKIGESYFPD
ncbi:MAG: hypothetical protein LBP34_03115 [Flavobacteriaceae bacterium]|jgi:DNA gyrase/topoisomerase IV subunit A|nr:hypothetical protein [Flavobacteriaceae bacterium]